METFIIKNVIVCILLPQKSQAIRIRNRQISNKSIHFLLDKETEYGGQPINLKTDENF